MSGCRAEEIMGSGSGIRSGSNATPIPEDACDLSFNSIASSTAAWSERCSSSCCCSSSSSNSSSVGNVSARNSSSSSEREAWVCRRKPRAAEDVAWEALAAVRRQDGFVALHHFSMLRKLGSGDIGRVFLCRLRAFPEQLFAIKMVDRDALRLRNKLHRADAELRVLGSLDHPFLPTLYAHFDASHLSCLVMDYAPHGDLHSLRLRQRHHRFHIATTMFYAAEVVVALEYLHMMGVVYRDLKPENVLVRHDGHIMLTDFDLCFKSSVSPSLVLRRPRPRTPPSPTPAPAPAPPSSPTVRRCLFPLRLKAAAAVAKAAQRRRRRRKTTAGDGATAGDGEMVMIAEPWQARAKSMVGTHEYLAPEVLGGAGHGGAVDWWALGVLLHEMLFAETPFRGPTRDATLANIVSAAPAAVPPAPVTPSVPALERRQWEAARDLIGRLLVKDPRRRLGARAGAAEVKRHPFFAGVDWPLIRSVRPPQPWRDDQYHRSSSSRRHSRPPPAPAPAASSTAFDYF